MSAFILTSSHSTEHMLPLASLVTKGHPVVFRGFDGLSRALQRRQAEPTTGQQSLWIFDQATFLAHATDLTDWTDQITLHLVLRQRGAEHAVATTVMTLASQGFAFELWTLQNDDYTYQATNGGEPVRVQSLPRRFGAQVSRADETAQMQITDDSRILVLADSANTPSTIKGQAFALPPLILAARRGEAPPDTSRALPDEQDLVHLVWALRDEDRDSLANDDRALEVLFCIPNGMGLGHLSRTLAVAQAVEKRFGFAPEQIGFWSYSLASTLIAEAGYRVIPRQTAKQLGIDGTRWAKREKDEFRTYLAHRRPRRVIVDHSGLEDTIMDSLEDLSFPCQKIWLRRAFWREGFSVPIFSQVSRFDAVITPGDLSGSRDNGPLATFSRTDFGTLSSHHQTPHFHSAPIVLGRSAGSLPPPKIGFQLPLMRRKSCLVSLGGAGMLAYPELIPALEQAARTHGVQLRWIMPPLTPSQLQNCLDPTISNVLPFLFPLAPYLNGFDAAILGGGYNSCHEAMLMTDRPCLFVPSEDTTKDDQGSRVDYLVEQNWAHRISLLQEEHWNTRLSAFFRAVKSGSPFGRPDRVTLPDGAQQIADYLENLTP